MAETRGENTAYVSSVNTDHTNLANNLNAKVHAEYATRSGSDRAGR